MSGKDVDREFAFDPMDATRTKDWELLARIRREKPVCRPAEGIVFSSRYHDTGKTFRDARRFSSAGDMRAPGVEVPDTERFLGEIDAPLHPKIRRILSPGFSRQKVDAALPWARANASRRLDALAARGGGDLMHDFAVLLPGAVSGYLLGLPEPLHDTIMRGCDELVHSTWPALGKTERGVGIIGAAPELAATLDAQIRERQKPGGPNDLLAAMVRSEDISRAHVRTLAINIMAGSLSASYLLGNLLYRSLGDESFSEALRADPAKIPRAVEESLRFEAPVNFLMRSALEDVELGGCPVARGEHVMLGIASANRDETVYENANEFQLDREGGPEHLAFGSGAHLCLGNHLSRMLGKLVLELVLERFAPGQIQLVPGYRWVCVGAVHEYGPETLDVVIG